MLQPKGHELVLVRDYKTLNEWFKNLSLFDKLNLYEAKIMMDSGKYISIKPLKENE